MLDTIRGIIRAIVRGLAFWAVLGATIWFIHNGITVEKWWIGFLMIMLKFYYDDLQNGRTAPPTGTDVIG